MTPSSHHRYAVVSPAITNDGPADVYFVRASEDVISLMTRYSNNTWHMVVGFSVWRRRTARSQWKLITDTNP